MFLLSLTALIVAIATHQLARNTVDEAVRLVIELIAIACLLVSLAFAHWLIKLLAMVTLVLSSRRFL